MRPVDWGWVRAPTAQPRPESLCLILASSPGAGVAGRLGGAGQHLGQTSCFLSRFIQQMCDSLVLVTEEWSQVPATYRVVQASCVLLSHVGQEVCVWGGSLTVKGRSSVRLQLSVQPWKPPLRDNEIPLSSRVLI